MENTGGLVIVFGLGILSVVFYFWFYKNLFKLGSQAIGAYVVKKVI